MTERKLRRVIREEIKRLNEGKIKGWANIMKLVSNKKDKIKKVWKDKNKYMLSLSSGKEYEIPKSFYEYLQKKMR